VLYKFGEEFGNSHVGRRLGRKRQHHKLHKKKNQSAVEQAAKDGTAGEQRPPTAGRKVNRRRSERDQKMEENSERGAGDAFVVSLSAGTPLAIVCGIRIGWRGVYMTMAYAISSTPTIKPPQKMA
jgi:hypothetical protein